MVLISGAMSQAREKKPGPPPLYGVRSFRGLPQRSQQRVTADNYSSDYPCLHCTPGRRGLRENPPRSLHWWGPVELYATEQGAWRDLDYDACVFGGPVRSITLQGWRLNHQRCVDTSIAQESGPRLWTEVLLRSLKQNTEYTPSLVFGQSQIRAQPRKVGRASIKWSWSWIQRAFCSTLYGLPRP